LKSFFEERFLVDRLLLFLGFPPLPNTRPGEKLCPLLPRLIVNENYFDAGNGVQSAFASGHIHIVPAITKPGIRYHSSVSPDMRVIVTGSAHFVEFDGVSILAKRIFRVGLSVYDAGHACVDSNAAVFSPFGIFRRLVLFRMPYHECPNSFDVDFIHYDFGVPRSGRTGLVLLGKGKTFSVFPI